MAARYWVGGANTWNSTAGSKWATTSGGAGGAAVPTAADDVFFDAASGANTVTLATTSVCRSIDCNGFTGSISHPSSTTVNIGDATAGAGNIALRLATGMTYTVGNATSSLLQFISTSGTQQTITTNGKTMPSYRIDGVGSSYLLSDSNTISSTSVLTLANGTLNTNNQTCSWGLFAYSTGTKTLTLGSSSITLTGTGTPWNSTTANTTFNSGTSTLTFTGSGVILGANGQTFYNVVFTGNSTVTITGSNATFNNFTHTPPATAGTISLIFQGNATVNGIFTVTGTNTGTNGGRICLAPAVFEGTTGQRTITVNGSFSFTNVDFHHMLAAGSAGTWTGTSMGDGGQNSNITFDASRTLYWITGTGGNLGALTKWSLSSGGVSANTCPLPQDDIIFDVNSISSGGQTIAVNMRFLGRDVDFSNVTNAPTLGFGGINPGLTGNLILKSGMAFTGSTVTCNFLGTGTHTITLDGVTPTGLNFTINPGTGSYTLQDDLTLDNARGFTLQTGTFNANDKNISVGSFTSGINVTRVLNMGSGTWTLKNTGTVWSISGSGMTLNPGTSTIIINDTSATGKTFAGFSLTYNDITVASGSGVVAFTNNSTWNNFTMNAPVSVRFQSSTTQTIQGSFNAVGSSGNVITIDSSTAGTPAILSKSSGAVISDYLSLKDSDARGGASWYAGANSTNVSGNRGWQFSNQDASKANFFNAM